jgi:hypothetical protein
MIKLKNLISESTWDRKFGEPLPTLKDVMEKQETCCDNCAEGKTCCETISEGPDEIRKSKKELQKLVKAESKLRDRMMKLEQVFLQDPTKGNDKLAKELNQSYKNHVTQFMRDVVSLVRKIK